MARRQGLPTLTTSTQETMHSGWQSLRQRKRNLLQYLQTVSVVLNRWTAQIRTSFVKNCVRNDAGKLALTGEDEMKAWVELYSRLLEVGLPKVSLTAGPLPVCPRP